MVKSDKETLTIYRNKIKTLEGMLADTINALRITQTVMKKGFKIKKINNRKRSHKLGKY